MDEVRETVANIRHRDFPVLDENQNYVGMFSRRNLMRAEKKKLILVDHNENHRQYPISMRRKFRDYRSSPAGQP